jgi:hypothetical protein
MEPGKELFLQPKLRAKSNMKSKAFSSSNILENQSISKKENNFTGTNDTYNKGHY